MTADVRWLTAEERRTWLGVTTVMELLPAVLDKQLQRDAGLSMFEYMVIAMLSETDGRTLRMSVLASATNSTLPRLSHVVSRLEKRGFVVRRASEADRRATDVTLTDAGFDHIVEAAPGHVRAARQFVIDALTPEQIVQLGSITAALGRRLDPQSKFAAPARPRPDNPEHPGLTFRAATSDDIPILRSATLAAMNWEKPRFIDADADRPEFAHYFTRFDGSRDRGVIAIDNGGVCGAAWATFLPDTDRGYGWVADDIPELTIAVDAAGRGRGIGTELLARLLAVGCEARWRGISLSVEDGNTTARGLYDAAGFAVVGRNGDSDTMLLSL